MAFEYLDSVADAGIRASGKTLNEAFCEAARAMFNLMVDIDSVEPEKEIDVRVSAKTHDLLLVEWLGRLLALKDMREIVCSQFTVQITQRDGEEIVLNGTARGEPLDSTRHGPKTEVKGVTYSGLRVWQEKGMFFAECVLDV